MSNRFSHIDDKFKDAFQQWEAPHTPEEMMGDWQSLSKQLPQAPANPSAPSSPATGGGSGAWGLGKLAAISGAAAVVATTAIIAYNIYKDDNQPVAEQLPIDEPAVVIAEEQAAEGIVKDNKTIILQPEMMQDPATAERNINENKPQVSSRSVVSSEKTNNASAVQTKPEVIGAPSGGDVPDSGGEPQKTGVAAGNEAVRKEQLSALQNAITELPAQICVGESLKLNTAGWPSSTTINWGDGVQGYAGAGSAHAYKAAGTYKLTVQAGNQPVSKVVKVYPQPDAHFNLSQSVDLMCRFKNSSLHGVKYVWDFGDSSAPVTTYNGAEHKYRTAGERIVTMKAYNDAGCADTTKQRITVSSFGKPEIKTAITPNGDGYNDEMSVIIDNEDYYSMIIMDLSGKKVFESEDKRIQWNGKYMNTGEMLPPGQYIYSLTYKYAGEGKTRQESGFVVKDPDLLRR